ncbi:cation transporter [Massilia sp. Root351]|jgi:Co/Zn/Cd efflux system component|uniref:cation transporter n=1 Tax=Massilia sp. Root351 TaxID=1736522 RepID=UPI00070CF160|nr:cation transporter [Massilia sp. Root351]KQV90707.1 cation transporter [Massilia sp. Root351]
MSSCCGGACASSKPPIDPRYRRILWVALFINAAMFGVELLGGLRAESVSLLADAVDFFGDAANYALSLFVLGMAAAWRARAALAKGVMMGGYGVFVLGKAGWSLAAGTAPEPATMGLIGVIALLANGTVALLLYAFRDGDANMRSVWLCSRNDAIGNVAVMLAALGVFGSGASWPDLAVAAVMAVLGLTAARTVIVQARRELRAGAGSGGAMSGSPAPPKARNSAQR